MFSLCEFASFSAPRFESPDYRFGDSRTRKRPSDDVIERPVKKSLFVDQDGTSQDSGFGDDWPSCNGEMTSSFASFDFLDDLSRSRQAMTSPVRMI